MSDYWSHQNINRRILRDNLTRNHQDLTPAERAKALVIAQEAFQGNTGNGEAARIGAESVRRLRGQ